MTLATAVPVTAASVGAISALAVSWRRALRAQNKSPRTIVAYLEGVRLLDQYLAAEGMPREVAHVRREHVGEPAEFPLGERRDEHSARVSS